MAGDTAVSRPKPPPSGMPPAQNLAPRDVAALADELVAYHARFAPLFRRREQRHWALQYLRGQLLDLERKSIEPMALALEGGNVQAMQQFISDGAWDDDRILQAHQQLVAETLGDPETGVLIIDSTEFPKQGKESVGVARQYCGALGKVANCQSAVVAGYASAKGYTFVDRRLYLPERWFTEAYAARRARCGVPPDRTFQTKAELAWQLIATLHQRGVLPFQWVTFDEHFGSNPTLLDRIAGLGLWYLAEVPHDTRVWLERPPTAVPPSPGKGRRPRRERVLAGEPAPGSVQRLAEQLPADAWMRALIREGAKGPLVAEFAFVRAVAVRDDLPGPEVWVVFRRRLGEQPELKVYLSNAPVETPRETLVRLSGMRWPIEAAIREGKDELGMDHYEVRGWRGWHPHLTMTFLAHHFLVWARLRLGEKIGGSHGGPGPATPACGLAQTPA
ncbi:MAG TPA: IS701 family transposase [Chloroflexota bacterium]